ncbi:hypothetical protein E2542_SST29129 [Spatholobus suberectus]|nr:hypothetical protein E2542_SST29129 [Spatholobus suberectus]
MEAKNNNTVLCKNQFHVIQEQDNAKWVTHYSSDHQILLVGEGDFSFSLSLAKSFGSAANIVSSSLNSYDDVIKMYKHAKSNLDDLHKLGACLLHGVDATKMELHPDLKMRRFDRVIFNFPHAGFHGREDNIWLIEMHKALVLGFFENARCMLRANGEIHVSHKTTAPFSNWNIEELATQCFLTLIECADFKREYYPGYNNKRGDSCRCDEPFPLGKCCTYKFIYNPKTKRQNHMKTNRMVVSRQQTNLPLQEIEDAVEILPTSVHLNYYPQTSNFPNMKEAVTSIFDLTNGHTSITRGHLSSMAEVHGRGAPSGGYSAFPGMRLGSPRALQPMEPLQSLQPWPTPTNVGYSLRDHFRSLDTVPISLGARNEGYQVYGGRSNYSQEELDRTMDTVPLLLGARNESYQVYGGRSNYLQEEHGRTRDTFSLSLGARNESYQVFGDRSNCLQEELGRTTAHRENYSFEGHTLRDTLLKWATPTNVGYSLRDHVRSMDTVPLSLGARNEGYQAYGGNSNYWQEERGRTTAQRSSYSFDGERSDFERYIAQMPGRTIQSVLKPNEYFDEREECRDKLEEVKPCTSFRFCF